MREAGVHHSGSRLERPRVAEGGPHEQDRVDTTIRLEWREYESWSPSIPRRVSVSILLQTLALRARQVRLALQHVDRNRALEAADAGWHGHVDSDRWNSQEHHKAHQ